MSIIDNTEYKGRWFATGVYNQNGVNYPVYFQYPWKEVTPFYQDWISVSSCQQGGTSFYQFYGIRSNGYLYKKQDFNSDLIRIGTASNWKKVWQFLDSVFALNSAGELYGWGENSDYQLGIGNNVDQTTPQLIATGVAKFSGTTVGDTTNNRTFFYLKTNGDLYVWGKNPTYNSMGLNATLTQNTPTQVATSVADVAAGNFASFYINTSGRRYATGWNAYYQLGNGSTYDRTTFGLMPETTIWSKIYTQFAIKSDGTLWSWGPNYYGASGTNNKTTNNTPVQIGSDTDWYQVSVSKQATGSLGPSYALAAKTNGDLYASGTNSTNSPGSTITGELGFPSSPAIYQVLQFTQTGITNNFATTTPTPLIRDWFEIWTDISDNLTTAIGGDNKPIANFTISNTSVLWNNSISITDSSANTKTGTVSINWGDSTAPETIVTGNTKSYTYNGSNLRTGDYKLNVDVTANNDRGNIINRQNVFVYGDTGNVLLNSYTKSILASSTLTGTFKQINSYGNATEFGSQQKQIWQWENPVSSTTTVAIGSGLPGDTNVPITHTFAAPTIANGVGIKQEEHTVKVKVETLHPNSLVSPYYSASVTINVIKDPILSFTTTSSNNQVTLTNTSLNADSYTIYWGDGTTSYVPANEAAGGPTGSPITHTYSSVNDTTYNVYITTNIITTTYVNGNAVNTSNIFTSASTTVKSFAVQYPTFNVLDQGHGPSARFVNTSPNTLGHTADFTGNKWRWQWGDGTYTDVGVGTGSAGDINIPITHLYTFTAGEILAGIPVIKTVILKAYNSHSSSPFLSISQNVTIIPQNPNFPNRVFTTLDTAGISDAIPIKTTKVWGIRGGGNT